MRVPEPRVEPLDPSEWDDDIQALYGPGAKLPGQTERRGDGRVLNIHATLARHPKLLKRWTVFGNHVLFKSTLPIREREILILRIGWLCRSEYEWGQHVEIGRRAGLSDEEIERIAEGPDAAGWSASDALLLRATDELHADAFISDETWKALSEHWDTQQLIDLVFAVGQYNLVSMALNTLGVQRDAGVPGFPKRVAR
jgi:alkylhydroperoxidase family enzyme